jgi:protein-disulfide isomerase
MSASQWDAVLTVPVTENRDHIQGTADAAVTLVEYGDYECPYCGAAHGVVQGIQRRLGQDLAYVFRNFPLVSAHPHALIAAAAAEAAGAQGRFWPMHDRLFEHQHLLDERSLLLHALAVGVPDVERFAGDLKDHRYVPRIRDDLASGARSGVTGTPTFFVNGVRHDGGYDAASLMQALLVERVNAGRASNAM